MNEREWCLVRKTVNGYGKGGPYVTPFDPPPQERHKWSWCRYQSQF